MKASSKAAFSSSGQGKIIGKNEISTGVRGTAAVSPGGRGKAIVFDGCGVCHTKATKGLTTLMFKKCGKSEIIDVPEYLSKISVYENIDQAVFVLLCDAGEELSGKKAYELVESYYQANETVRDDHIVLVPQALIDTIGNTWKFLVKVSSHNLTGKTQSLTVTNVFPLEAPVPDGNLCENVDEETCNDKEDPVDESVKRSSDEIVSGDAKCAKCG
ncbi:unnamed protein product [Eruca vesicaria subsp. sativa]|uniref:Uncharacterized protein n=1 Tax=Eruca vesicaria subsp. sativa TaxID=29727 RepID=A0ABC8JCF7_ERUVS|nr:unnamed protein product [Eruca vesicaria subsp. sativa]